MLSPSQQMLLHHIRTGANDLNTLTVPPHMPVIAVSYLRRLKSLNLKPWLCRWAHVLEAQPGDAQRAFCSAVLHRLARLSYYEKVQGALEGIPAHKVGTAGHR